MRLAGGASVLVTGASGSLGWVVGRLLTDRSPAARPRVTGTYLAHHVVPEGVAGLRLDLGDEASIAAAFERARPAVVVHTAAVSDPDACERDPAAANSINFEGTRSLAALAARAGAPLVFISTDLVFDGVKGNYAETDPPRPLGAYSASKLLGEEAVLGASPRNVVLRSALIYGFGSPSSSTFLGRMLEALAAGRPVRLFTDQRRSPVLVDDLARGTILAIERGLTGLYHLGGADALSRYEFGLEVCRAFGYDEHLLVPAGMADFTGPARRPPDASLNSAKLRQALAFTPCGVREGLERVRKERVREGRAPGGHSLD